MTIDKDERKHCFPVVVEKQAQGYFAFCPLLTACFAHGKSYEKVLKNLGRKIREDLGKLKAAGRSVPGVSIISLAIVEVSA